jgi:hypothetical protein
MRRAVLVVIVSCSALIGGCEFPVDRGTAIEETGELPVPDEAEPAPPASPQPGAPPAGPDLRFEPDDADCALQCKPRVAQFLERCVRGREPDSCVERAAALAERCRAELCDREGSCEERCAVVAAGRRDDCLSGGGRADCALLGRHILEDCRSARCEGPVLSCENGCVAATEAFLTHCRLDPLQCSLLAVQQLHGCLRTDCGARDDAGSDPGSAPGPACRTGCAQQAWLQRVRCLELGNERQMCELQELRWLERCTAVHCAPRQ